MALELAQEHDRFKHRTAARILGVSLRQGERAKNLAHHELFVSWPASMGCNNPRELALHVSSADETSPDEIARDPRHGQHFLKVRPKEFCQCAVE